MVGHAPIVTDRTDCSGGREHQHVSVTSSSSNTPPRQTETTEHSSAHTVMGSCCITRIQGKLLAMTDTSGVNVPAGTVVSEAPRRLSPPV
jgi:hypothetical protein